MSLQTWINEFYPTHAYDCPEEEAVKYSLRKWKGLLPKNLKKHDVIIGCNVSVEDMFTQEELSLNSSSCALCKYYLDKTSCKKCPLTKVLGLPCDKGSNSPWKVFTSENDPKPMIEALEKC